MKGRPQGEAQGKAYLAVADKPMGGKARRQPSARAERAVDGHKESPEASKSHTDWNAAWERPFCVPSPATLLSKIITPFKSSIVIANSQRIKSKFA